VNILSLDEGLEGCDFTEMSQDEIAAWLDNDDYREDDNKKKKKKGKQQKQVFMLSIFDHLIKICVIVAT
jgi:hypothetical protein